MKVTQLYEELLAIDNGRLEISLKNHPPGITIISWGGIESELLSKIINIVEKRKAECNLSAYGTIDIAFKEDD